MGQRADNSLYGVAGQMAQRLYTGFPRVSHRFDSVVYQVGDGSLDEEAQLLLLNRSWTACECIAATEWRANGDCLARERRQSDEARKDSATQVTSRRSSILTKEIYDERQDFQVSKLQEHK